MCVLEHKNTYRDKREDRESERAQITTGTRKIELERAKYLFCFWKKRIREDAHVKTPYIQ